jgi:hypothetical protein
MLYLDRKKYKDLDFEMPVEVAGVRFRNPFYVSSGPTTSMLQQLFAAYENGFAGVSIKLTFDPPPYINRKPRYGWDDKQHLLYFSAEKRIIMDEACRLITNPIDDFSLDYDPRAVQEIVHLTHCQPYLVQLMGSLLVDWLNDPERRRQGDWHRTTMEDVAHAAEEALHVGRGYFTNLWKDAGEGGHRLLREIAREPEGVSQEVLTERLAMSPEGLDAALTHLRGHQLIEETDARWRVQVELTRRAFARGVARL